MAIQLNLNPSANSNAGETQDRKKSMFWLNVGFVSPMKDENGEPIFISLPMGIALDDMKAVPVRGKNPEWIQMAQAKNSLMEQLQKAAADLEPGEEHLIPELTVQLRRNPEDAAKTTDDNPHMTAINNLFNR